MLHCNFCGATITKEDRTCRTCGSAVATAPVAVAAASGQGDAPLRQWGGDAPGQTSEIVRSTLYEWQSPASDSEVAVASDAPFEQSGSKPARSYSRLRVYLAAAVVAVVIVAAYMLLVGGETRSNEGADNGPAQDVPTVEATPADGAAAEPETSQAAPEPVAPAPPQAAATEAAQPANSLTLTFDAPPASATEPAD